MILENEDIMLVVPTKEHEKDVWEYRQKFLDSGEKHIHGSSDLQEFNNFIEWFNFILSEEALARRGWVLATQFIAIRKQDNKMVGMIHVRHNIDNDFLREIGGHIGYSVAPDERRKGYASSMLRLSLDFCREIKIDDIFITCYKDNIGSRKTIENCGFIFEGITEKDGEEYRKYWIRSGANENI